MSRQGELYACLYVRELPAQALLRERPELRNTPCVVMEGKPPLEALCSLNTKARLLGLTHRMNRMDAESVPGATILSRSRESEAKLRSFLLEVAGEFSPRIEELSKDNIFLCGIDIQGTENIFGTSRVLGSALLRRVRSLGISARVTISHNLLAAVALAKGLPQNITIQVIPEGEEPAALSPLPLAALDLSSEHTEVFALWGIHTLGMLANIPEEQLISRLGQDGRTLRQLARGERPHLFQPGLTALRLNETKALDFPLENLESLLFGIALMLDGLITQATENVVALASISLELTLDDCRIHIITVEPALPTNDKHLWLKLLHQRLETNPPGAPVAVISLYADPGTTSKVQLGLFSPQLPESGRLEVALARIASLVGESSVGCAVLDDTHAAESFRIEHFKLPSNTSKVPLASKPRACCRILRPEEPVSVRLQGAEPSTFVFRNFRYSVEHAYGPWRASGGWWGNDLWGSEQWDLVARGQDAATLICCLRRNLVNNQWLVTALYD